MLYSKRIQHVIDLMARLPSIGPKTAGRLVFFLLHQPKSRIIELATALTELSDAVTKCTECRNFAEASPCPICADTRRNKQLLCVISKPQDIEAIERSRSFDGHYYLLSGTLETFAETDDYQQEVRALLEKVVKDQVQEVILTFNPDVAGETTLLYIKKALEALNQARPNQPVTISRPARGLPMGADVEYMDDVTLENALKERKRL